MLNHTILQGRLTRDPEMRKTQTGSSVAAFTVAWSEKHKETEKQLFLDCTAWSGTADLVSKYFEKGKEVIVEGKLGTDKWEDKDGNKRSTIKMTVERVHFCGSKSDSDGTGGYKPAMGAIDVVAPEDDGDLPF